MRFPILRSHRIDLWLLVPVILALALTVISFFALRNVIVTKDHAVLDHAPDLISIQRMVIDLEEVNESGRGFLFDNRGEPERALLRRTFERQREFFEILAGTRPLLSTREGEAMLQSAAFLAGSYVRNLDRVIGLKQAGAPARRVFEAYRREVAPRYQRALDALKKLSAFKQDMLQSAIAISRTAAARAVRLILLSGLTALVLSAILSLAFIRALGQSRRKESALRESLQVRDEFLSVASHELKNPVTALLMQTELLGRMIPDGRGEPLVGMQRQLVNRCLHETRRLATLTNELLDLTRLRVGKMLLDKCRMELGALVREVAEAQMPEARAMGSSLEIKVKRKVVGNWDPTRISQVVYNLVSNAIKYGKGNPITLCVDADRAGQTARITVADRGLGMTREVRAKIFRRFERGGAAQKIRGLGLGLYIVRQIVQAHGGTIAVRSTPGKGSVFVVRLPMPLAQEAVTKPCAA